MLIKTRFNLIATLICVTSLGGACNSFASYEESPGGDLSWELARRLHAYPIASACFNHYPPNTEFVKFGASQNAPFALNDLGCAYFFGIGVPEDYVQARHCFN